MKKSSVKIVGTLFEIRTGHLLLAGFLLGLFLDPEDGDDMLPRNVA
jgi:hypothetical protein